MALCTDKERAEAQDLRSLSSSVKLMRGLAGREGNYHSQLPPLTGNVEGSVEECISLLNKPLPLPHPFLRVGREKTRCSIKVA